ncbi:hypothetical protein GJV85_04335 [Sulfurimonas aquatica]|uniref:DUF4397 domain-containing protein n=1 Tax=Sulfurimonas aquatica TaxID=2672570 RepID=A0A975GCK2_9BACT|nr:hypothetical protein [Sulfurimonas aquatica]QSZ41364.1 hypothetical protein GJV85_04335 [Sulfurimonas aquatica]
MTKLLLIALLMVSLLLTACGGGDSTTGTNTSDYLIVAGNTKGFEMKSNGKVLSGGTGCISARIYDSNANSLALSNKVVDLTPGTYTAVFTSRSSTSPNSIGALYTTESTFQVPAVIYNNLYSITAGTTQLYKLTISQTTSFAMSRTQTASSLYDENLNYITTSDTFTLNTGTYYLLAYSINCGVAGSFNMAEL